MFIKRLPYVSSTNITYTLMLLTQTAVSDSFWVTFVKSFVGDDLVLQRNWSQQLFMFTVHFANAGCVEGPPILHLSL